ncbi:MAG: PqqD family peptide modification chaperone [Acidimicrobiales bacterium]
MTDLTQDSVVVRSRRPLTAPVNDDLVMLDPDSGNYYGLDDIGQHIWSLISEPAAVGTICSALMADYDVDEATCRNDVIALLSDMVEADLVTVTN